jgi:hypothetical protein
MASDRRLILVFKSGATVELQGEAGKINLILTQYQAAPGATKPSAVEYVSGGRLDVIFAELSGMITKPE